MRMKNTINKRIGKINDFLESKEKPSVKGIHRLRLEVKHLQAFLELMSMQSNFESSTKIPENADKLFHQAGKLRKYTLETQAIESISKQNRLLKPKLFLRQLKLYEEKSSKKLRKEQKTFPAFKAEDFVKHPGTKLFPDTCKQFLAARSLSILDLLKEDILADIRTLHQLRKIFKSIIYISPFCTKDLKPIGLFLETRKKFMHSIESKIGSLHDTDFFIRRLEKKHDLIVADEDPALRNIKREWQHDIKRIKNNLQPLLQAVKQFALDLKGHSGELVTSKMVSQQV